MGVDLEDVAASVRELRIRPRDSGGAGWDAMNDLVQPLIDAHGVDAVIAELATERNDPDIAEALFFVVWTNDRSLTELFSDEEIVEAAHEYLRVSGSGSVNPDSPEALGAYSGG